MFAEIKPVSSSELFVDKRPALDPKTVAAKLKQFKQFCDHENLDDAQLIRVKGARSGKRLNLPILQVEGTHFDVGFQIGRTFSNLINEYINSNQELTKKIELYETHKGKLVYDCCFDSVCLMYPEYIREIKGIAEGSGVPFYKLFILHMDDIMLKVLPSNEIREPSSYGTTTIIVNSTAKLMGHVQDHAPVGLGNVYVVKARITEECPCEEFTAFCIGGLLPGSTMAINNHGLALCVNPVEISKCNECGIPRSILCRALLKAENPEDINKTLSCKNYGVANGMVANFAFGTLKNEYLSFFSVEIGPKFPPGTISLKSVMKIQPPGVTKYYHFNKYQNLNTVQPYYTQYSARWLESRELVMNKIPSPKTERNLIEIVGDSSVPSLDNRNIYSAQEEALVVTVAVGIFNFIEKTWSLYLDNPKETEPSLVIPLNLLR